MAQQENQALPAKFHNFVLPRFHGSPGHFRSSRNIGFICLDSGKQVCKPADLRMLAKWGIKVPNGAIAVLAPSDLFKVPASKPTDFQNGIFESEVLKYASFSGFVDPTNPNFILIYYAFRTEKFIAGVVLRLGGEGNLSDEKPGLNIRLDVVNQLNKKAMQAIKKLPPLPTIPPPSPRNGMSHPPLPIDWNPSVKRENLVPVPIPAPFELKSMLYATYCPITMVSQFAWLSDDSQIGIQTFDFLASPRWYPIQCSDCLLQVQRAVRALGYNQPFVTGEDLPELQLRPPYHAIYNIDYPENMPFDEKKQMVCRYKTKGMPGFYCFIMGWDNVMTPYTYDGGETFTEGIPEGPMEIMKEHTKKRNLAFFVFRDDIEKMKHKIPLTLAMITRMIAEQTNVKSLPRDFGAIRSANRFYGHLPLAFTQNIRFKLLYNVIQEANAKRDENEQITEVMLGNLVWKAMLNEINDA